MKMIKIIVVMLVSLMVSIFAEAQNLNNPNKEGPLGTQVNTISGNLFIPRTDFIVPARGFNINASFYYNSYDYNENRGFGNGWNFFYNIYYSTDTANNKIITWGDGREDRYTRQDDVSFKAPRGFFDVLSQYQSGKFLLSKVNGDKYYFDDAALKKITRIVEPNGNSIYFNYSDTLLTSLVNTDGQSVSFTYNSNGQLSDISDAITTDVRTFSFIYDNAKNLVTATDPLGHKFTYTYLTNGPMKTLADKNANKIDIIYYSGYSVSEVVGCNKRMSFSYDTLMHSTVATDHMENGNNQVTTYKYEIIDRVAWLTDISGNCCGFNLKYEYDKYGNKVKTTDANGNVTHFTYDTYGNMLTMTDALSQTDTYTYSSGYNRITSYKDHKGNLYNLTYDTKGNLTQITSPENQTYSANYNANGDIISSTDSKGNVFTYNYDAFGNPTTVIGPENYSATLSFDARGNLLSYTDANGNNTYAQYDILNRLKKITDPINENIQLSYDANGNAVSTINQNNEITSYHYDASDRLTELSDPMGNKGYLYYDAMDNLKSMRNALGNGIKMDYDTRNRLTSVKDSENNSSQYNYDAHGNVISMTMKNGRELNFTYDNLHRVTAISDDKGQLATLSYDVNGNVTSYINGTGATTTATYDNLNRPTKVTDPLGNSSSFTYDKNNNVTSITDRNGFSSYYTYDNLNRVETFTNNIGAVIKVDYDVLGNVSELTDQNNHATSYTYDELNRQKKMTFPDGTYLENFYDNKGNINSFRRTDGSTITYQYDTLKRMTKRTLPDGQVFLNRVISETFDGRTTSYQYDIAGSTQTTTYPDGSVIQKEFDTRSRLLKISKDSITIAQYAYNNADQLLSKTYGNGVITTMQYDFANRLSSISTGNGSIQNTSFTYDKEYNKTAIVRNNNLSLSEQFMYDKNYRLSNYKRGTPGGGIITNNSYTYDALGNRLTANLDGVINNYTINNLNQITGISGGSNITFQYDGRGNLIYDGHVHKKYDSENRLIKDSTSSANMISYNYDALNRRVVKWINNNPLKYSYSGVSQIEERDGSNNLLNSTVFTNFLTPVLNEKSGNQFYYHQNELNSVEGITNSNGNLVEQYRYDSYGKLSLFDGSGNPLAASIAGNRFAFTGQEYDSASGSYRFFYRNYSPETGVFNQRDLIGYGDGMGMYQYVGNNPANGVDVWGLNGPGAHSSGNIIGPPAAIPPGGSGFGFPPSNAGPFGGPSGGGGFLPPGPSGNGGSADCDGLAEEANRIKYDLVIQGTNISGTSIGLLGMFTTSLKLSKLSNYLGLAGNPLSFIGATAETADYANSFKGNTTGQNISKGAALANTWAGTAAGAAGSFEAMTAGGTAVATGTGTGAGAATATAGTVFTASTATLTVGGTLIVVGGAYMGDKYIERTQQSISDENSFNIEYDALSYQRSRGKYFERQWIQTQLNEERKHRKWSEENDCPPSGGSRRPHPGSPGQSGPFEIISAQDPNEMIGPDGQLDKKWMSTKDRLPYTILYENSIEASAPAKFIRITTPVEPKQDATTLQIGSFGFNSTTFSVKPGTSVYYNRVDARDSIGLYIDVTAGCVLQQSRCQGFYRTLYRRNCRLRPDE